MNNKTFGFYIFLYIKVWKPHGLDIQYPMRIIDLFLSFFLLWTFRCTDWDEIEKKNIYKRRIECVNINLPIEWNGKKCEKSWNTFHTIAHCTHCMYTAHAHLYNIKMRRVAAVVCIKEFLLSHLCGTTHPNGRIYLAQLSLTHWSCSV